MVEAHASTSNWTRTLLSNHVARTTFEWDVLTLSRLGQSLNSSPVLFSVVMMKPLKSKRLTPAYALLRDCSAMSPYVPYLSGVKTGTAVNTYILLGKLIMNRYVAESITMIAGHFGHEGLCQLRTKHFDKVAMSLYNITCILYIYKQYICSIYAVYALKLYQHCCSTLYTTTYVYIPCTMYVMYTCTERDWEHMTADWKVECKETRWFWLITQPHGSVHTHKIMLNHKLRPSLCPF